VRALPSRDSTLSALRRSYRRLAVFVFNPRMTLSAPRYGPLPLAENAFLKEF